MCPSQQTQTLHSIYTRSDQRLRRWSDVVWMLYKCFVFWWDGIFPTPLGIEFSWQCHWVRCVSDATGTAPPTTNTINYSPTLVRCFGMLAKHRDNIGPRIGSFYQVDLNYSRTWIALRHFVPLDMKGCICHLTKLNTLSNPRRRFVL